MSGDLSCPCITLPPLLPDDPLDTAVHQLGAYPDVTPGALCRHARAVGLAVEALVDSLLMRRGLVATTLPGAITLIELRDPDLVAVTERTLKAWLDPRRYGPPDMDALA